MCFVGKSVFSSRYQYYLTEKAVFRGDVERKRIFTEKLCFFEKSP